MSDSQSYQGQDGDYGSVAPIVILDNGSDSIKAGFAGETRPRHIMQNCGAQPLGWKRGLTGSAQQQGAPLSPQLLIGDDISALPDYFCLRPHQYGLLMDANLEITIWEKLFSKSHLNIADPTSFSLIVTEQFNTPTAVRQILTQIVFEEFGFDKMVISPAQQLVPFAFASAAPATPVDLWAPTANHHSAPSPSKEQTRQNKKQRVSSGRKKLQSSPWDSVKPIVMGDSYNPRFSHPLTSVQESYCQLVVDVGHQTSWVVPMYGELPLEVGALRIDLGGAHSSALMKNLLLYQQVNLERNELLVHHIKEESCFVSLNYLEDLQSLKRQYQSGRPAARMHLAHQYLLPDFNSRDKNALKNFFKTNRPTSIPIYTPVESEGSPEFQISHQTSLAADLRDLMRTGHEQSGGYLESFGTSSLSVGASLFGGVEKSFRYSSESIGIQGQTTLTLNVERIAPAEVFFNPQDYDFLSNLFPSNALGNVFSPSTSCGAELSSTKNSLSANDLATLHHPNPAKQASIAEVIQRSIFSSPPVLQSMLASKILLCGGSSGLPNFARRLYCELRPLLPQDWPINIYQLAEPSETAWIGASVWASENSCANYDLFCITKSQYLESGATIGGTRNTR